MPGKLGLLVKAVGNFDGSAFVPFEKRAEQRPQQGNRPTL